MKTRHYVLSLLLSIMLSACDHYPSERLADRPKPSLDEHPQTYCNRSEVSTVREQQYAARIKASNCDSVADEHHNTYIKTLYASMAARLDLDEFDRYRGQQCILEVDLSVGQPHKRYIGDSGLCFYIHTRLGPVEIAYPPDSLRKICKQLHLVFRPGRQETLSDSRQSPTAPAEELLI